MKIRVTRTVLVEEIIEYETKERNLRLHKLLNPKLELEDGDNFINDFLLIGKEIDSITDKEGSINIVREEYISDPTIIKIERI